MQKLTYGLTNYFQTGYVMYTGYNVQYWKTAIRTKSNIHTFHSNQPRQLWQRRRRNLYHICQRDGPSYSFQCITGSKYGQTTLTGTNGGPSILTILSAESKETFTAIASLVFGFGGDLWSMDLTNWRNQLVHQHNPNYR